MQAYTLTFSLSHAQYIDLNLIYSKLKNLSKECVIRMKTNAFQLCTTTAAAAAELIECP